MIRFTKLISVLLIISALISSFGIYSFASDEGGVKDTMDLLLNRTFDEGWSLSNGLAGVYKAQRFAVDYEELPDFTYNYYAKVEVIDPTNGSDGYININVNSLFSGGTVLQYDINTDSYTNSGFAYVLTPGTSSERTLTKLFEISGNSYVIQNGTYTVAGKLGKEWIRVANVYNYDQTKVACSKCKTVYYTTERDSCPKGCQNKDVFHMITTRVYFGYRDTFDIDSAIVTTSSDSGKYDLNKTYAIDGNIVLNSLNTEAALASFRFCVEGRNPSNEGEGYCFDNIKLYNDPTPKDEKGNIVPMYVRDDITVETHGYGRLVNSKKAFDIPIKGGVETTPIAPESGAIVMKVGSDYMLLDGERAAIYKSKKTGEAYGMPVKRDGVVYVPFETIMEAMNLPVYIHDDGLQYDISTSDGYSVLTLYRDTAVIDGERVLLTGAPFMAQDPGDPENNYPVVALDDVPKFFKGYFVTYDEMGLFAISERESVFTRETDLNYMMSLMKRFIFDNLPEGELYEKLRENTDDFTHPYIIADQEQFDYLAKVYAAHTAREAGEDHNEEYIDDTLYSLISAQLSSGDSIYKKFTTLPANPVNYTYREYANERDPQKYKELAFEITNPFYGIKEGQKYTNSNTYRWDYIGPADENGDYWGKLGVHYNDGYDWAGGRNTHAETYAGYIRTLALAYNITGDEKYAQLGYDIMISLCDENNWHNWSHHFYLSTGQMLLELGLAYDWLYNIWSEIQYERAPEYSLSYITQNIYRKGIYYGYEVSRYSRIKDVASWDYDNATPDKDGYYSVWNWSVTDINWNGVCNSGIIVASIAIVGEDSKLDGVDFTKDDADGVNRVRWSMRNNLFHLTQYGMAQYCPDGSYIEGAHYWSYGTVPITKAMWAVSSAFGDDLGLFETWGFDKTFYFAVHTEYAVYDGLKSTYATWQFHDDNTGAEQETEMFFFAADMLDDVSLAAIRLDQIKNGKSIWWTDLLGYKRSFEGLSLEDAELSLDYRFEACEGAVSRSSWEVGHTYSGIMGNANNCGNHGQMDSGMFTYEDDGYTWFPDMGADEYNVYEYWGEGIRQFYYRNSAEGHNQIILTSQQENLPYGQSYTGKGVISEFHSEDAGMYAILNNTTAYGSYANFANRGMLVTNNRETVVIQDEISFKGAESMAWIAHTLASEITLSEDKRTAYLSNVVKGKTEYVRVSIVAQDTKLKFEIMTCGIKESSNGVLEDVLLRGIHNSTYSPSHGSVSEYSREKWKRLVIKSESTLGFNCAVVIEDVENLDDPAPVRYDYISMNTWADEGIKEEYDGKNVAGGVEGEDSNVILNPKIGDISTYGKQAQKLIDTGYALTTRIVDFFKNLVRVNSAVNTFRPETFKNVPQVWQAYEQYLKCLELYKAYSFAINDEFKGACSIAIGLVGISGK